MRQGTLPVATKWSSPQRSTGRMRPGAADYDSRIVTIGQLILFSTKTGDAWLLDPADQSAARLAREGESEPIHIEETDTTFAHRLEGPLPHRGTGVHLLG